MRRVLSLSFLVILAASPYAGAVTGTGDSATGALDTVKPTLDSVAAVSESSIDVTFSEPMLDPAATTPANYAVSGTGRGTLTANPTAVTGSGPYSLTWTSGEMYAATITVTATSLQDAAGNPIDPAHNTASAMGIGESLPLSVWPLATALLAAGLFVLTARRSRTSARTLLILAALIAAPAAFAVKPTLSNVAFTQSPNGSAGTKVDITYDLVAPNGPCTITVSLSKNGGADGFVHPVTSITGDLLSVTTGSGHITWDIVADYPNENIPHARIRVTANDGAGFGLPVTMVPVSAGTFTMGNSGVGDDLTYGRSAEFPKHSVTLSAYQIGRGEVTNRQFCDVLNWALAQGYLKTSSGAVWTGTGNIYAGGDLQIILNYTSTQCAIQFADGAFSAKTRTGLPGATIYSMDAHPVGNVSWYGAVAFCNWLSQMDALTPCYNMNAADWPLTIAPPTSAGYRLPTEAEWERAAAWDGAKHWIYGFTSDTQPLNTRCNWYLLNPLGLTEYPHTSPGEWFDGVNVSPKGNVATINSASPVGAYDMSGNVWEWCDDSYGAYGFGAEVDPTRLIPGADRICRGGSWGAGNSGRSADREDTSPTMTYSTTGFRIARS